MRPRRSTTGSGRTIRISNLLADFQEHSDGIHDAISRVLASGTYILGENVEAFEREFSSYCGTRYGIGVASGTDALTLSLMALGVGNGDEVITVANTASPTAMAILNAGATPRLVDPSPDTFVMDISNIENGMTSRTRAVIPVHLYGNPCNMRKIMGFAKENGIFVVEDCCQAHGACFDDERVGSFGDTGCFSFYPTKNLGGYGDGGMIVTHSKDLAYKIRALRFYGMEDRHSSQTRGLCSRLDELHAAILRVKLKDLDAKNERRRENAAYYKERLRECARLRFQEEYAKGMNVYHQLVVGVSQREILRRRLLEKGIETAVHYPVALCDQPAYRRYSYNKPFAVSRYLAKSVLSLPVHPYLDPDSLQLVCDVIQRCVKGGRQRKKV